jgi:putative zinc finger protein
MHPTDLDITDYVDDSLSTADRAAVDRHLEGCPRCRELVADFLDLRRASAALGAIEPPSRTWSRIEAVISSSGTARSTSRPTTRDHRPTTAWLAAAAALVLAITGGLWTIRASRHAAETAPPAEAGLPAGASSTQPFEVELAQAEQHYQKAISGLERIANDQKGALDPMTAATLRKNLGVVDQAINESRAALHTQPNSDPARESLLESFRAKVDLLQNTIALINEMRKGNDAGAAQIISGLKRGN